MSIIKALFEAPQPLGPIGILVEDSVLHRVELEPDKTIRPNGALPVAIREQLTAYFEDGSRGFDLPLGPRGTDFQKRVWAALQEIPAGCTITYGELAQELETCARAIGGACRANPWPIVVPCHRVIARNGLGGYVGDPGGSPKTEIKQWLLDHEQGCR